MSALVALTCRFQFPWRSCDAIKVSVPGLAFLHLYADCCKVSICLALLSILVCSFRNLRVRIRLLCCSCIASILMNVAKIRRGHGIVSNCAACCDSLIPCVLSRCAGSSASAAAAAGACDSESDRHCQPQHWARAQWPQRECLTVHPVWSSLQLLPRHTGNSGLHRRPSNAH